MKRSCVMACALVLALSGGIAADAYTNYCDGATAASVSADYPAQLKVIGDQFDVSLDRLENGKTASAEESTSTAEVSTGEAEEEPVDYGKAVQDLYTQRVELFDEYTSVLTTAEYDAAAKLIDYDLLLKKLKLLFDEYKKLKEQSQQSAAAFRTGGCDKSVVDADKKAVEAKYYEIQALLSEISALKAEIEAVTGTTLTSDFDFEQAYLITDVMNLDPEALTMITGGASLGIPEGIEPAEYEAPDITGQYNAALKCYYALGTAMREYIAADENVRRCESAIKLGEATADQLEAAQGEKTTAYMNAWTAKADLAKSLIELDKATGGALTNALGISWQRASQYKSAVSEAQSGSGLWVIGRTAGGIVFMPMVLPNGVAPEEDDTVYYTLKYNGGKIGSGGGFSIIQPQQYDEKHRYATVTYYVNGVKVGVYKIDVFSPYGEFIG